MNSPPTPPGGLELGPDVEAVLHPEEKAGLAEVHAREPMRCWTCGSWVDPADEASVSMSVAGDLAVAELAHLRCAPPRADLAPLVALALADPQGVAYAQALHREAGAVLVWQRKLDIRLRGSMWGELRPYVDGHRGSGFHPMRRDKPVRLLDRWRLAADGPDLVLSRAGEPVDRFDDAAADPPLGWFDALEASGHCLLIVGAELAVEAAGVEELQRAMRSGDALMGLVEFVPG